ncbi:hypothetical protein JI747_009845 [Chryseobacterium sp. RG1]|uniref:Dolichyl-phosphate-mannose-protein mannosyltransferase n=1 Tax=Chryseobacterium tagetis TaxID=2801334 RepID=A0ABS8A0G3_9FLAO|nr:hypothetical protein [Chryseobacterium tagetis]MCA6067479.1 hypothetical protein [Chryseobacterium tagetis]
MHKLFDEKINDILFVIIFPFLLLFMAYYGFESSYVDMKMWEKAPDFMFSSVYAYRVIPNYLSVHISEIFTEIVNGFPGLKVFLLKHGTLFYHSVFIVNSFFFVLSSVLLSLIFKLNPSAFFKDIKIRRIVHLLAVFLIVITQYVPTNCDVIAVFFYLFGILFTLRYFHYKKLSDFLLLFALILISTFVRETSCLNIAFFAALFVNIKKIDLTYAREIIFLVAAFLIPYLGLKYFIPQNASFAEGVYLVKNFTSPFNLSGLFFGVIGLYFAFTLCTSDQKNILKKYLLFSSPYILMIAFVGIFWETRLFIPLLLTSFVIASHEFKKYQITS